MKKDEVLSYLEENKDVKFVNLLFPDILGTLRGFSIPSEEIGTALDDGKGFDGSSIEGLVRIEESDLVAKPNPETFSIFPWEYEDHGEKYRVGLMFCDILNSDKSNNEGDTRYILKETLKKARKIGFDSFKVGPELEFFYFENDEVPKLLDEGEYFSMGAHDRYAYLGQKTMLNLEKMKIKSEFYHHEVASSQHEIDLKYKDALEMADAVMLSKFVVKETARKEGIYATFMPKPLNGVNGSGMHVHQSLWKDERNAFFDKEDKYNLSDVAKKYMSGLLHHVDDITSVLNQYTNSYKRLVPGYEAPVYHVWGQKNRSALIRVPEYQPGKEKARRIELRSPDPSCNPYLAFAVMLAAGLDGIENDYELPQPQEKNAYKNTEGLKTLPKSLEEAINLTKKSELVKETLGDHVFKKFIENKEKEIELQRRTVTDFDVKYYLRKL